MVPLRPLLRATGQRPFFIRRGMLSVPRARQWLMQSDHPAAPALLEQLPA